MIALFQSNFESITGTRLTPYQLKQWLIETGTPQFIWPLSPESHIGPRANVFAALEASTRSLYINQVTAPDLFPPGEVVRIQARVRDGLLTLLPNSVELHYRFRSETFQVLPMTLVVGTRDHYEAFFPAAYCGETPQFFIQAMADDNSILTNPIDPSNSLYSRSVGTMITTVLIDEDFESGIPPGWTGTGLWHASTACSQNDIPCDGSQWAYFGDEATCSYDLGHVFGSLTLPPITFPPDTPMTVNTVTLCHFIETEGALSFESVDLTVNGFSTFNFSDTNGWITENVDLNFLGGSTSEVALQFDSRDDFNNLFNGWMIDRLTISSFGPQCDLLRPCPADCSGDDRIVSIFDLLSVLSAWGSADPTCDISPPGGDGVVNIVDLLEVLAAWGPCDI